MSNDDFNDYHTSSPLSDLTEFHTGILYCINRTDEPHSLAIKTFLEDAGYEVHHGRLYPSLDDLVERGFVEKQATANTTRFVLTTDGRDWLNSNRDRVEQFLAEESNRRPDRQA